MTRRTYSVPAISCGHCVATIERELQEVAGVRTVRASANDKTVEVEVESEATLTDVESLLEEIGFPAAAGA